MNWRRLLHAVPILFAVVFLFGLLAEGVYAQDASISGVVTDAGNGDPLPGATILIEELERGVTTNVEGEYAMGGLPSGTYTMVVRYVGYQQVRRDVDLSAGDEVVQDFALQPDLVGLEEVVVTGQAGQVRQREIGSSISRMRTEDIIQPSVDMENLLEGRSAGVSVLQTSGQAGSGGQIRIRGNVSVSMSNQPLLYLDGVRMRSEPYPRNVPPVGFQGRGPNITATPINDINPSDIESVEIIKGAAATTLYGSEAAAGVIQIFTKTGSAMDRPIWSVNVTQGFDWLRPFGMEEMGAEYMFLDPFLRTAYHQNYHASVRGGDEDLQYFASGGYLNAEGVLPNDYEEKLSFRSNLRATLLDNLVLRLTAGYTRHDIENTPSGNNAQGLTLNAYRRDRNYIGNDDPDAIAQFLNYEIFTLNNRFTLGATALYQMTEDLEHDFTVGYDYADSELRQFRPVGFVGAEQGIGANRMWNHTTLTLDYTGTYDWRLNPDFRMNIAWGGEHITSDERTISAYGEDYPGPGEHTITSAANRLSFEDRMKVIRGGIFSQVMFDYMDRYFATVGLRIDGNSAFGSNLGLQPYPKVNFSYVLSDEPFWNEDWGSLRLRAAYGWAGRAPGAFDAVRTWDPVGWGRRVAFRPSNVGNPELGPERTAETEFGVDGSFLNDRLTVDFTYYYQRTTDGLFFVRQIPSQGFLSSQLENVGELQNQGIELSVDGTLIRQPNFNWSVGLGLSTNHSKVLDLGGAAEFSLGDFGWIIEGQSAPVIMADRITNPDEVADPVVEEDHIYGPNQPTHIIQPRMNFTFPYDIMLSIRGEYQGGFYLYDGAHLNALARGVRYPTCAEAYDLIDAGQQDQLTARQRAWCQPTNVRSDWFVFPGDFFKLREVSMRAPLPWQFGDGARPLITVSGRNLWDWNRLPIMDPEITWRGAADSVRSIWEHIPPAASVRVQLSLTF